MNMKTIEFNESNNNKLNFLINELDFILENKNIYPNIFLLLTKTSSFCQKNFNELSNNIIREKRFLNFETSSRINVEHEYTINDKDLLTESEFYYLFTPNGRLDWLEIKLNSQIVTIASSKIVKEKIFSIISDEFEKLRNSSIFSSYDKNTFMDFLYSNLTNLPCFIEYLNIEKRKNFLIKLNYFASIEKEEETNLSAFLKISFYIILILYNLFRPIKKQTMKYNYIPLNNDVSSWLYIKAPKHFEIKSSIKNSNVEYPKIIDPEISSAVINSSEKKDYEFTIDVKVPQSLYLWFSMLYWISFIFILSMFLYIFDKINLFSRDNSLNVLAITNDLIIKIDKSIVINISIILATGIITTRGWLIYEENILKRLSNSFSLFIFFIFILNIIIFALDSKDILNIIISFLY